MTPRTNETTSGGPTEETPWDERGLEAEGAVSDGGAPEPDGAERPADSPTSSGAPLDAEEAGHSAAPSETGESPGDRTPSAADEATRGGVPPAAEDTASGRPSADSGGQDAPARPTGTPRRSRRLAQRAGMALLLAVAVTGGAIAVGAARDKAPQAVAVSAAVDPGALASGDPDAAIAALQAHLKAQPRDADGWATLGLAYVEQARTKGDPARYPQAQAALKRALSLAPHSDQALAGQAALAAARHDFKGALTNADRALAENPYSERALSSRIDALVELGRYDAASRAADTADARKPGVPVFTRYAYVRELRGDVPAARRVLEQALGAATSKGDIAYVAAQLGQLAWNQGDYKSALTSYARALAADENYLPALEGRARAQAASGDRAEAIKGMELVVSRYPLPAPLVELGELYEARGAAGDRERAHEQYALVEAWIAIARANGVDADLDTALAAADHGDKKAALRAARAEWTRRHTVHTADALAWALHVNGHDREALSYARRATATGYQSALFRYHLGVIELATGHERDGRASLKSALKLNPGFSPLGAATARKALESTK
ncbi:tetratricopeptide repeat protein [Streptomyces sp. LaPpAH-108]|uniref:tetratricopeptide repeat protein n=1 Tax=Streptomyces sp. LaPpAH-108 TaxID=1155714 RepID=UPI0003A1CC91|nr:tetratricopeptide repeat protein [Streptomyces sp. LaPpAH-108]